MSNYGGSRMGMNQMNGNRRPQNINRVPPTTVEKQSVCNQHEDLIKYIYDSWTKVSQEIDRNSGGSIVFYQEPECTNLKNFEPFDLEAFWGKRVVQTFQQPHNS